MATPRTIARRTVSVAAGLGIIAVLHEFGVKYAEQMGWYDNLPSKLEAGVSWLVALAEPTWFKLATAFVTGTALGMWIDVLFRRREERQAISASRRADFQLLVGGGDFTFDCSVGKTFVFVASGDVKLHPPIYPREGAYDIIVIYGSKGGYLSFGYNYQYGTSRILAPKKLSNCTIYLRLLVMMGNDWHCLINLMSASDPLTHIPTETASSLTKGIARA